MNCISPRGCGKAVKQRGLERFAIACTVGADLRVRPGLGVRATTGADLEHTAKAIQVKPTTWNGENVGLRLGNHR
jgi:hypothetical protein